jgi:recombination associated protein RdgC
MKNAIVFAADLPSAADLTPHLEQRPWRELHSMERKNGGFVALKGENLVEPLPDAGYALRYRIDERLVPASIVNSEVDKEIEAFEENRGRRPNRVEKADIKESVLAGLLEVALIKTSYVRAYYHEEQALLFVDTTSDSVAQAVIGELIHACESVKTQTIHVTSRTKGLKPRLVNHINGDPDGFVRFEVGNNLTLARKAEGEPIEKVTYKDFDIANEEVRDLLGQGFQVEKIELSLAGAYFHLTDKFRFRRFDWPEREIPQEDVDDDLHHWRQEAAMNTAHAALIVASLCEMMEYRRPTRAELNQEGDDAGAGA